MAEAMNSLEWLFKPIQPFVAHPERIVVVAGVLFLSFFALLVLRRFRSWPLLIPACGWGLFAIWEAYCEAQGYNIRVDLLLVYPVLVVITLWGAATAFRPRTAA